MPFSNAACEQHDVSESPSAYIKETGQSVRANTELASRCCSKWFVASSSNWTRQDERETGACHITDSLLCLALQLEQEPEERLYGTDFVLNRRLAKTHKEGRSMEGKP